MASQPHEMLDDGASHPPATTIALDSMQPSHQGPRGPPAPPAKDEPAPSPPGTELRRAITIRQLVGMTLGNAIGAGLLVGSGRGLAAGGPASLVLAYAIVGVAVVAIAAGLGEMATENPVAGAFYDYALRFIGEPWGYAVGINYAATWLVLLPFELTAIAAQLRLWVPQHVNPAALIAPFLVAMAGLAAGGGGWFAEAENVLGQVKALALVIL